MKTCTRCHEKKPLEAFHKNPSGKDGRLAYCAECKNKKRRKFKTCGACQKTKPITEFRKHPQCSDGHRGTCKECQNTMQRESRGRVLTAKKVTEMYGRCGWL